MNHKDSFKLFIRILKANLGFDMSLYHEKGKHKVSKKLMLFMSIYLGLFALLGFYILMNNFQGWFQLLLIGMYDGVWIGVISAYHNIKKHIKKHKTI